MSIQAVAWALEQQIPRASEKFVLVCLCNYADQRGICYPSCAQLEHDTSMDRKTVLASIKGLVERGVLIDTGKRVGVTRRVIVYRIVGLTDNSTKKGIDPEFGIYPEKGTVSEEGNSTVFPDKQSRFSQETVPKTGHGSVRNRQEPREGGVAPLRRATAARLPDDFALTPERAEVARREAVDPERTFAGFRDHWAAASGAKARKHDWDAAWRTWCRNENNFRKGPVRAGPPPAVVAANEERAWTALKARAQAIGFREPYAVETVSAYESAVRIAEMKVPRGAPIDTSAILAKMRMPA